MNPNFPLQQIHKFNQFCDISRGIIPNLVMPSHAYILIAFHNPIYFIFYSLYSKTKTSIANNFKILTSFQGSLELNIQGEGIYVLLVKIQQIEFERFIAILFHYMYVLESLVSIINWTSVISVHVFMLWFM